MIKIPEKNKAFCQHTHSDTLLNLCKDILPNLCKEFVEKYNLLVHVTLWKNLVLSPIKSGWGARGGGG